jgi:thioredoxin reductase
MSQPATHETDVLVVGSGNGALTAALCARELGVRDVLLIEKSPPRSGGLAVHVAKGPIGRSGALYGVTPIDALTVRR